MNIVVDCGCADIGTERSIDRLIGMFQPRLLVGCDPNVESSVYRVGSTTVVLIPEVAWTELGTVDFVFEATRSRVTAAGRGTRPVRSFDLAHLLDALIRSGDDVVLKLDVEGAEYRLLPHLWARGIDGRLLKVLVEWHPQFEPEHDPLPELACPVEEWA